MGLLEGGGREEKEDEVWGEEEEKVVGDWGERIRGWVGWRGEKDVGEGVGSWGGGLGYVLYM